MPWIQGSFNCVTRNFNCLPFVAWEQAVKRVSARTFLSFTRGKKSMSWIARAGERVWIRSTSHCLCQTPNLSSIRLKSSRGRRNTRPAALIMMAWTVFKMIRTPILDSIQSSFIWRTGSRERSEVILSIYEIFYHFLSFVLSTFFWFENSFFQHYKSHSVTFIFNCQQQIYVQSNFKWKFFLGLLFSFMVGVFLFPKRPMDTEIVSTIFFRIGGLSYVKTDVNKITSLWLIIHQ